MRSTRRERACCAIRLPERACGALTGLNSALAGDTAATSEAPLYLVPSGQTMRASFPAQAALPAWLSEADLADLDGAPIEQPSLFAIGEHNSSRSWLRKSSTRTRRPCLHSSHTKSFLDSGIGCIKKTPIRSTASCCAGSTKYKDSAGRGLRHSRRPERASGSDERIRLVLSNTSIGPRTRHGDGASTRTPTVRQAVILPDRAGFDSVVLAERHVNLVRAPRDGVAAHQAGRPSHGSRPPETARPVGLEQTAGDSERADVRPPRS